jgi:hypothetical protein
LSHRTNSEYSGPSRPTEPLDKITIRTLADDSDRGEGAAPDGEAYLNRALSPDAARVLAGMA